MYFAKELTQKSLPEIGELFGGRDHTTVLHAVRKIDELRGKQSRAQPRAARAVANVEGMTMIEYAFRRTRVVPTSRATVEVAARRHPTCGQDLEPWRPNVCDRPIGHQRSAPKLAGRHTPFAHRVTLSPSS